MVRLLVCSVYNMSLMSLQDYNNLKLEYVLELVAQEEFHLILGNMQPTECCCFVVLCNNLESVCIVCIETWNLSLDSALSCLIKRVGGKQFVNIL